MNYFGQILHERDGVTSFHKHTSLTFFISSIVKIVKAKSDKSEVTSQEWQFKSDKSRVTSQERQVNRNKSRAKSLK